MLGARNPSEPDEGDSFSSERDHGGKRIDGRRSRGGVADDAEQCEPTGRGGIALRDPCLRAIRTGVGAPGEADTATLCNCEVTVRRMAYTHCLGDDEALAMVEFDRQRIVLECDADRPMEGLLK